MSSLIFFVFNSPFDGRAKQKDRHIYDGDDEECDLNSLLCIAQAAKHVGGLAFGLGRLGLLFAVTEEHHVDEGDEDGWSAVCLMNTYFC